MKQPHSNSFTFVADQGSVQNLRVTEETTDSFRVSWQPAPGAVNRYQLKYEPVGDERWKLETTTVGPETTIVLQELQPQTTYRVTVIPEYQSGSGVPMQTDGTTKEGECGFILYCYTLEESTIWCWKCPFAEITFRDILHQKCQNPTRIDVIQILL